ncbi:MAG: DUF5063 domain-containing protein [Carbonactinosporaceae bacterium]
MSDDLTEFSAEIADQIESFIIAVTEVARGDSPDRSVSMLLLEVSQLLLAGGRLGAIVDVIPEERFEPDAGPDPDVDDLRVGLARLLEPIDIYTEVFDPYDPAVEQVICSLSDDIADVVADLVHGLQHYRAGRPIEALWWWQFSYLSNWGSTASSALRALQAVVAHARLDASETAPDDGPEPGHENGREDGREDGLGRLATASAPGEATGGGG